MIKKLLFAVALVLSAQCVSRAQNILVLEDGGTQDSVHAILSQAGFNVTLGGPYWQYTGVDVNQYQLIVFLNGVIYSPVMADSVQLKIRNYVGNGGGLLTTEWLIWSGAVHDTLTSILPVLYGGSWSTGSEIYRKQAIHPISASLPDSFVVPPAWSFSHTVRDTSPIKQAITIFEGSSSEAAVVAGRYGNGKVVHWNMGGQWNGANIWSTEVKALLRNIASYTQGVVSVEEHDGVQQKFALEGNYPNPFNPTTTIHFSLPRHVYVMLKVYDALGREVATLVDGEVNSGKHSLVFDAKNLASGIYFYRLQAAGFVETRKLILLR